MSPLIPNLKFTELAKFQPKQLEAWYLLMKPECKYELYGGAAGGGKSYYLRWAAIGLAMYYASKYQIDRVPIGLFSEDYPTLRDRQVTKIMREFPVWLGELKETQRDGLAFYLSRKYGSGVIMLRNLDDPSKYASVEFAAILVEELTKNKEDTFEDLRTRLRFPGIPDRKFVGATNPGQIGHGWVKKRWVKVDPMDKDIEQDRFFFVPARSTDNKYNPEDYEIQLSSIKDPQKRKALLEGSWDVFEGQYFDTWNYHKHVINPFIPSNDSLIVGGMDWGRAKPFSFHLAVVDKIFWLDDSRDSHQFFRVKTFFETYGTEKNPEEWGEEIKSKLKDKFNIRLDDLSWVQADPTIFNKGNDNGISIRDQFFNSDSRWRILKPAKNDRFPGWMYMKRWLSDAPDGLPYWQITSNCTNLIRTLPDLVHDANNVEDLDSSGEDHSADDQRYMLRNIKLMEGFTGQIKSKKYTEIPDGNKGKFFAGNENPGNLMIKLSKFK